MAPMDNLPTDARQLRSRRWQTSHCTHATLRSALPRGARSGNLSLFLFGKASQRLVDASGELVTVSQSGDMKAIGRAVGTVGGTCKNCHDNYRASN